MPLFKLHSYRNYHNIKTAFVINRLRKRTGNIFFVDIKHFDTLFNQYRYAIYSKKKYNLVRNQYLNKGSYFNIEDQYFSNPFEDKEGMFTDYDSDYNLYDKNFVFIYKLIKNESLSVDEILFHAKRPSQRVSELYFFTLYALFSGNTERFILLSEEYYNNKKNRYESLILNEEMNTFTLLGKDYIIGQNIIEIFYNFYVKNEYIEKEIEEFQPKNYIEKKIFTTILKHYYTHSEQHALIHTLNEEL